MSNRSTGERGFTLIELMIVVAIIGILAAVAVPAFMKYIKKARSAEARTMIEKLSAGARQYYLDPKIPQGQVIPLPPQFPETQPVTPAASCCAAGVSKCVPSALDWNTDGWDALNFQMDDPHYYRYRFISSGVSVDAEFTARAHGDLDCDGLESTFETWAAVQVLGNDMSAQAGITRIRELE